jgi:hypothetical protein
VTAGHPREGGDSQEKIMRKTPISPYRHWAPRDTMWIGKGSAGLWGMIAAVSALAGGLAWFLH